MKRLRRGTKRKGLWQGLKIIAGLGPLYAICAVVFFVIGFIGLPFSVIFITALLGGYS